MDIQKYISEKVEFHNNLLEFINSPTSISDDFQKFINYVSNLKIIENRDEYKIMLHLLYKITKYHRRSLTFFVKIEQILLYFGSIIKQTFSNSEIFDFFQNNKRIILFLFEKKIIIPDKSIIDQLLQKSNSKDRTYRFFFFPEIKNFVDEKSIESIKNEMVEIDEKVFDNFEVKRQKGENETYICNLIREDSIIEFVSYVNRTNFQISSSKIHPSIFETNSFLIKKNVSLIEYAAFYGSIQIFQYLLLNKVQITPLLWLFAIHGRNPEIIHLIEENHIAPPNSSYEICLKEAIKCHHNEIANYIIDNLLDDFKLNESVYSTSFRYYNYFYFPKDFNNKLVFDYVCGYDYFTLVKLLVNKNKITNNSEEFFF